MEFNISEEIARFLHFEIEKPGNDIGDKLSTALMYNLNKEKLEEALRKKLLIRYLDNPRFDIAKEKALSNALREYFGGKFNHRLQLILDSRTDEKPDAKVNKISDKLSVVTIPATAWPSTFPSPLRSQVIEKQLLCLSPNFMAGYK